MTAIPLAELVEDLDWYPRASVSGTNVANLAAALRAGDELPPPIVDRKSKRIVDGVHRCRAYRKVLGADAVIEVQLRTFKSDVDLFAAAVESNAGHGLPLQEIDKRRVVLRLQDLGANDDAIGQVLHMPAARVRKLVVHSATVTIGGGELRLEALKRPTFHLQGQALTEGQVKAIRSAPGTSYSLVVRQLREAITYQLLDADDSKLVENLAALHTELGEFLLGREEQTA